MNERSNILEQMRRAWEGEAWHGPALLEILADVSWEQAAARPLPGAHNIWEITLHVSAWLTAIRDRLRGEALQNPKEGDWPEVGETGRTGWENVEKVLRRRQKDLLEDIGRLSDEQLHAKVPGKDYTVYFMLQGVVQHDLYHAGQIALLKKA